MGEFELPRPSASSQRVPAYISITILQKTHLTLPWTIGAGLSRRSLPALPVRLDAGGAHRVAGEAVGARAGGRGGGHTGVDRPSWHVHDAPDVLGRRGGAVLADGHAAVAVVDNYCPNCPHVQFKASASMATRR